MNESVSKTSLTILARSVTSEWYKLAYTAEGLFIFWRFSDKIESMYVNLLSKWYQFFKEGQGMSYYLLPLTVLSIPWDKAFKQSQKPIWIEDIKDYQLHTLYAFVITYRWKIWPITY